MYKIKGINPNTSSSWNLIQGINLNYIPRSHRKAFVELWKSEMENNGGNVEFTWETVQFRFPYLESACRRYMLNPIYRIQSPQHIPFDNLEDVVVSTWGKDFSKKLSLDLAAKRVRALGRAESFKEKYTKKWGGYGSSFYNFARNLFKRK